MVVTEDQVTFSFKSSKRSNNGTDANAGQIPQLLYRLMCPESGSNQALGLSEDGHEPVYTLSKEFATSITHQCFNQLLALLKWIWKELQQGLSSSIERKGVVKERSPGFRNFADGKSLLKSLLNSFQDHAWSVIACRNRP